MIALKTSTATAITYTNCCGAFFIMRVTAIESIKDGVCRSYGEGEYIGDKEPNGGWMKDTGIKKIKELWKKS